MLAVVVSYRLCEEKIRSSRQRHTDHGVNCVTPTQSWLANHYVHVLLYDAPIEPLFPLFQCETVSCTRHNHHNCHSHRRHTFTTSQPLYHNATTPLDHIHHNVVTGQWSEVKVTGQLYTVFSA